jgi:hypothetical protein
MIVDAFMLLLKELSHPYRTATNAALISQSLFPFGNV